eukprot:jgi/Picre1/32146/NNA_007492.t1
MIMYFPSPKGVWGESELFLQVWWWACSSCAERQGLGDITSSSSQDRESRTVLIQGIDPNTPDNILKEQFECFGDIQSISLETKMQGYMMITYHDIRAARLAMHSSGTVWRGRQLSCTMLGQDVTVQSSSPTMLYLISLDGGKSLDDVYYLLSSYGELKDLKQHPYQQHCCMAEFYDSSMLLLH